MINVNLLKHFIPSSQVFRGLPRCRQRFWNRTGIPRTFYVLYSIYTKKFTLTETRNAPTG
ncbi:hypothetical protein B4135_2266 [Caldibacillus debilis]|uniref:Uncharacterized protein n=1 Tax=Caldibacillus debilis TaxID=301148 RepID=A0A150M290_9BACI|nr:hypothetical protein B4135_2266 [Caldibacillus debilis]